MGLYYWRWTWNGTPTSNFFLPPTPLQEILWMFTGLIDSVKGLNFLDLVYFCGAFSYSGGRKRGQISFVWSLNGGIFYFL
jgi:hypothetical protein